jgi:hypothetical protein
MSDETTTTPDGTAAPDATTTPDATVTTPDATTKPDATTTDATNMLVGLPENLRSNERLKDVKSLEDLANRLVNAKFAPEIPAPDGYKLPDGVPVEIGQFAHKNNLSQEQLDSVLVEMARINDTKTTGNLAELAEKGQAKLKEWGDNAQEYTKLAVDAVNYFEEETPGLKQMLKETGYGNHPQLLEVFRQVGVMIKEGGFVKGENYTPANKKTQAERMFPTQAKIN